LSREICGKIIKTTAEHKKIYRFQNPSQPSLKGRRKKIISPPLGGVRGDFKGRLKTPPSLP